MLTLDVIEGVEEPTGWVSPFVLAEKSKDAFRMCLDKRPANQAIVREKHPVQTDEATLQGVFYAEVFSKTDFNRAFFLIELHPDSRDIKVFGVPDCLYRFKRLPWCERDKGKSQQIAW